MDIKWVKLEREYCESNIVISDERINSDWGWITADDILKELYNKAEGKILVIPITSYRVLEFLVMYVQEKLSAIERAKILLKISDDCVDDIDPVQINRINREWFADQYIAYWNARGVEFYETSGELLKKGK